MGFLGIIFFIFILSSFYIINAGHRGILLDWGQAESQPIKEGLHFKIPIKEQVITVNVQEQKAKATASAATKDKQVVTAEVSINYHLSEASLVTLYNEVGLGYSDKIIAPALQDAVKSSTAQYTADQLLQQRGEVGLLIYNELQERFMSKGIILGEVYVENLDFSPEFDAAIEAASVAKQNSIKAENDKLRIEAEAQQAEAKAKGEAAAVLAKAEAEATAKKLLADAEAYSLEVQNKAVTSGVLELRKIEVERAKVEQWTGEVPKIVMGESSNVLWSMPDVTQGLQ